MIIDFDCLENIFICIEYNKMFSKNIIGVKIMKIGFFDNKILINKSN